MSLVAFALRLVASRLLRGQTWADDQIYNSPIDPVAQWQAVAGVGEAKPCIAIYTGKRDADVTGKMTQGTAATVDMTFAIFLPPSVALNDGELTVETTNTGGAMVIDFMARQIEAAFRFGPQPWKQVWDILVLQVLGVSSRPLLYEIDKAVQIPCVEVTFRFKTCPDPDFGASMRPGWQALYDAMLADPDYASTADLLKGAIETPQSLSAWRAAQAALGSSDAALATLAITPLTEDNP